MTRVCKCDKVKRVSSAERGPVTARLRLLLTKEASFVSDSLFLSLHRSDTESLFLLLNVYYVQSLVWHHFG